MTEGEQELYDELVGAEWPLSYRELAHTLECATSTIHRRMEGLKRLKLISNSTKSRSVRITADLGTSSSSASPAP